MYKLFPAMIVFKVLGVAIVGIWSIWATFLSGPDLSILDHTTFIWKLLGATAGLSMFFNIPPVYGFVFGNLFRRSNLDIAGLYRIEMDSNWPVIERLVSSSKSTEDSFDVNDPQSLPQSKSILGYAIVEAGLFNLKIKARMDRSHNRSVSRGEDIRTDEHKDIVLRYVYVQTNEAKQTSATDDHKHTGAAELRFYPKEGDLGILTGKYWTNRNFSRGMNTAGEINLVRVKRNVYQYPAL